MSSEEKKVKIVGGKKYTLNEQGVYVDKDGYGSKALGYQTPKKSAKKKPESKSKKELKIKKKKPAKTQNFKMVGGKKYTLNEQGVYVDKDGYGARALGLQIPKKVRKNAEGEWELVSKKKPELKIKKKKKDD